MPPLVPAWPWPRWVSVPVEREHQAGDANEVQNPEHEHFEYEITAHCDQIRPRLGWESRKLLPQLRPKLCKTLLHLRFEPRELELVQLAELGPIEPDPGGARGQVHGVEPVDQL